MTSQRARSAFDEWPTLLVVAGVYVGFWFSTTILAETSVLVGIFCTAIVIAQFSSLQHEVLHGHPFRNQRLNEALVFPSLTMFIPYQRFRDTHLAHHHDEILTDPYDDPESNYLDPEVWIRLPTLVRAVLQLNNTLGGRILFGPLVSMVTFLRGDWTEIRAGNRQVRTAWQWHIVSVALVLCWLQLAGSLPFWAYFIAAYFGFGLLKIRTFLEHRAHDRASGRTVVIDDRGPLAFLFLNNNLHVVHHMHPTAAWYRLPGLFHQDEDRYLTRNGGYAFANYAEIFRKYFFSAKDPVPHPIWRKK